jgi:hypothetical protein
MKLFRLIMESRQRKADREIERVVRRKTHHEPFAFELERRMLGQ